MKGLHAKRYFTAIFVLAWWVMPAAAQTPPMDPNQLRPFIKDFEEHIALQINGVLPGPFALSSKPIGFFKDGSGYTFIFAASIGRGVINSPVGIYANTAAPNAEQRKIIVGNIRDRLVQLLFDQGPILPRLQKDMAVTIAARLDYFSPFEDSFERTIIMTAKKSDIDEFCSKSQNITGFKTKVAISEY